MPLSASWKPPRRDPRPLLALACKEGAHEMAQHMIDASRPNVPVELGRLRDSGKVTDTETGSYAGYGFDDGDGKLAPTKDYAVKQHEDRDLNHPNGGGPKWLENAKDSERDILLKTAAISLEKVFR